MSTIQKVSLRVPVLIVGTGPVGLSLASDLGWRGVPSLVVEQNDRWVRSPRIMQIGVRTMEFARRLGIAEKIHRWGFPLDFALDNVFLTTLNGYEIARFKMFTLGDAIAARSNISPEHQGHCPQTWFDPLWMELAESFATNQIRFRHRLTSFCQDEEKVLATIRNLETGEDLTVHADFLVGCDGVDSLVRDQLGISMRGTPFIDESLSIELRTENLSAAHNMGNAGRYVFVGPRGTWGTMMAVDGRKLWRILLYNLAENIREVDPATIVRRMVGADFAFEIVGAKPWARRALVADRYQDGRVFLAGDAVHTHPPNGGLGMNTGMQDAMDLGWKLAAVVDGWAPRSLLDSYDIERRPVGHRTVDEAMTQFTRMASEPASPHIDQDSPEGEQARAELRSRLVPAYEGIRGWHRFGIHLGYIYDPSPIIIPDGTPRPEDDRFGYEQNARPGSRAPHAWLADGRSTLDLFGRNFVLLRFDKAVSTSAIDVAAAKRGMKLDRHDIDDPAIGHLYGRKLVLVRPDGHVAWRDDELSDADVILDRLRGAGGSAAAAVDLHLRDRAPRTDVA